MPTRKDIRILVVDDFKVMRSIVVKQLKALGYTNVIDATDGKTALKIMKSGKIDLVLADWIMPQMSGLELLKVIRADEALQKTPFIMVSAEGQTQNIMLAIKEKVTQYIVKPFTPETLAKKIELVFPDQKDSK